MNSKGRWYGMVMAAAMVVGPAAMAESYNAVGSVALAGDSTLHKYQAEAKDVTAHLTAADGQPLDDAIRAGRVTAMDLSIPVGRLSSGESGLDKNLRETLKSKDNPLITFRMQSYEVVPGADLTLLVHGTLKVAGVEKPADLRVTGKRTGDVLRLTGTKALKMTEFGIKPPVFMLGTLKTKDDITVSFDLAVKAPATPAS